MDPELMRLLWELSGEQEQQRPLQESPQAWEEHWRRTNESVAPGGMGGDIMDFMQTLFSLGPTGLHQAIDPSRTTEDYDPEASYAKVLAEEGMPWGLAGVLGTLMDFVEPGPNEWIRPLGLAAAAIPGVGRAASEAFSTVARGVDNLVNPAGRGAAEAAQAAPRYTFQGSPAHVIADTRANAGGTYHGVTGEPINTGYSVSIYPDREVRLPVDGFTDEQVVHYTNQNRDLLRNENLGTWIDDTNGEAVLDVSRNVKTAEEARELSLRHHQEGYFDHENKEFVRVQSYEDAIAGREREAAEGYERIRQQFPWLDESWVPESPAELSAKFSQLSANYEQFPGIQARLNRLQQLHDAGVDVTDLTGRAKDEVARRVRTTPAQRQTIRELMPWLFDEATQSRIMGEVTAMRDELASRPGGYQAWYATPERLLEWSVEDAGPVEGRTFFDYLLRLNANLSGQTDVAAQARGSVELLYRLGRGEQLPNITGDGMSIFGSGGTYGHNRKAVFNQLMAESPEGGFGARAQKTSTYAENLAGHREGYTMDVHDLRSTLLESGHDINTPEGRAAITEILAPILSEGELAAARSADTLGRWSAPIYSRLSGGGYYGAITEATSDMAARLGMDPAEFQALKWLAYAQRTGVRGSSHAPFIDNFMAELGRIAEAEQLTPRELFRVMVTGAAQVDQNFNDIFRLVEDAVNW